MAGNNTDRILAALATLQQGQEALRASLDKTRADIMERLDRQQARLDNFDGFINLGLGAIDRVDKRTAAQTEDGRLLGQLLMELTHIVRRLEGRVNRLEEE